MVEIKIDLGKCNGCGTCVDICPMGCFELGEVGGETKSKVINPDACVVCRACEANCPNEAIEVIE